MIEDGKYDYKDKNINAENYPITKTSKETQNVFIVGLGKTLSSKAVIEALDAMGLRPATLPELLALGRDFPEEQRERYCIVAIGSVSAVHLVPILSGLGPERNLSLRVGRAGWSGDDRFAAVRK